MNYRDLTIRVLGDFSDKQYASLAYEIGLRLEAAGLGKQAILVADSQISGTGRTPSPPPRSPIPGDEIAPHRHAID
ncbi:MAG: hypothetical protein ABW224_08020 [Kibdelosporangium sp.]